MLKKIAKRIERTGSDLLYAVAPVWHLTNLKREAVDQLEDLHYQVGLCQANANEVQERLAEIEYMLKDPDLDEHQKFSLEGEKRQLENRFKEIQGMEEQAVEVREAYEESLPKIVSDLELAIQMSRQAKAQKNMAKLLTGGSGSAGSDVQDHIKKVRAQAYAVNAQVRGQLMSAKSSKGKKLLGSNK